MTAIGQFEMQSEHFPKFAGARIVDLREMISKKRK